MGLISTSEPLTVMMMMMMMIFTQLLVLINPGFITLKLVCIDEKVIDLVELLLIPS